MSTWADATSRQRGEAADAAPCVYRRRAGAFRLTVHRHIHHAADVWLFTCEPITDCQALGSKDPIDAQKEADALFWLALHEAIRA